MMEGAPDAGMLPFRTSVAEAVWPAVPTVPGAMMLGLLFQLEQTQWLAPGELRQRQFAQLDVLIRFLWQRSPFYRQRFEAAGWQPGDPLDASRWRRLPELARATVQTEAAQIAVAGAPVSHGKPMAYATTGSLGMPVRGLGNELTHLYAGALTMRNHLWHKRDFAGKFAAIRTKVSNGRFPDWGLIESAAFETGPGVLLDIATDIDRQLDWLCTEQPQYLLTHPSNLRAMLLRARERDIAKPQGLLELSVFGEMLPADLRGLADETWKLAVVDMYSSEEFGTIALQCPADAETYHLQAENVLVEIVNDEGKECAPGEIGKVLVSTLHNFTMPLLRYEIGDYAEAAPTCNCRRGLPAIRRIVGRRRNMLRRPDGGQHWPSFPYEDLRPIIAFRQIRIVQHTPLDIEVILAGANDVDGGRETAFARKLCELLRGELSIRYSYCDSIPAGPGGKFEDFVSHCV